MAASPLQSTQNAIRQGVKAIVHGPPKIGKTMLAATCPNTVILSSEQGLLSLRHHTIPYYDISTPKLMRDAIAWVKTSAEVRKFQTVFWDSVTVSGRIMLRGSNKTHAMQAYGEMQTELEQIIDDLQHLNGPNIVMLFQSEFYVDAALGTAVWMPTIPGKSLKPTLGYLPDEVFYMYSATDPATNREYRALRTQPDFRTVAGDRSGALSPIEPPDLGLIFNKITKG